VHTETAVSGVWSARFTYLTASGSTNRYSDLHLTVLHAGALALDVPVTSALASASTLGPGGFEQASSIRFYSLVGSSPELVITLFWGGAHCCYVDQVFDFNALPALKTEFNFGDTGAKITPIRGAFVFVGADARFDYAFTDYADSASPIEIWRYTPHRFIDVTLSYPSLVERDAARWWRYFQQRTTTEDVRGILGAWAADKARLGQRSSAASSLLRIAANGGLDRGFGSPKGSTYIRDLWVFLAHNGYL
jgi:hypothetical protein